MTPKRGKFAPIDFKTRFPALDGLRALAITMVFVDHYGGGAHRGTLLRIFNDIRGRGWVGVDLFFVLSGFLITGILYDTRDDSQFFRRFFARRSLRILPVYYMVFVLLLLLTPVLHYHWQWLQLTFLVYIANFFGNYNWSLWVVPSLTHPSASACISHFWSLCVEEQFYFLWPLAVWFIRDRVRLIWTAVGFSGLALILRLLMIHQFGLVTAETWIFRTLPFRMDALLAGAILALLLRGSKADLWQRRSKWVCVPACVAVLAIFAFSPAYDSPWEMSIGLTLTALASAGLIGTALRPGSLSFRLFTLKPLRTVGKYSYGFYVYHVLFRGLWGHPLFFLARHLHSIGAAGLIVMPVNFAVTFLVSKLSFDLIEVKFLRLKRYFEYDSEQREHRMADTQADQEQIAAAPVPEVA